MAGDDDRRDEGAAGGDAGRDQVLPGKPGVRRQEECRGDVAAAAGFGDGAAAAGLLRELLGGVGGEGS